MDIFKLPDWLNKNNYKITDSIKDHKQWRAMTYSANNGGKKGQIGEIGYIWISLKDNTIIPISRGDEHHMGSDALYSLVEKLKVSVDLQNYVPIWSYGENYIYNKNEIPDMVNALRKFLSYGGPNGILHGANDLADLVITSKQFVTANGKVTIKPGTLAPLGKKIYEGYSKLANALNNARGNFEKSAHNTAFRAAVELSKELVYYATATYEFLDEVKELPEQIKELKDNDDISGLENLFFGFDSIKNKIHISLKNIDKNPFTSRSIKGIWGDIPLAIDMLGRF